MTFRPFRAGQLLRESKYPCSFFVVLEVEEIIIEEDGLKQYAITLLVRRYNQEWRGALEHHPFIMVPKHDLERVA